MPKRQDIKKVLVIGSGPIVIGQAAEFDYSGTQACKALKEEGIEVVLLNSNPATIMTDTNIADKVYIEPLTVEFAELVIQKERPQGLLPTLGGQTGLNLAAQLAIAGILEKYQVELLGTPLEAIQRAEDRELFKATMEKIGEPILESLPVENIAQAITFAEQIGYPVIVRPAYTLGGTGGGIAYNSEQLKEIVSVGLTMSMIGQVLIERCVLGWKEVEYEVMRDTCDNCITVCNMENFDPMGIHTGDSIVVAPSQTLSDKEYQLLRTASLKIIRALDIKGGCNIQFALDTKSMNYYVIEVNPRVSRSSALASKATGYPIARVAAKIAIGLRLDEIPNAVTGRTLACFEPALDYVVVKIPRWPFDKFASADRRIGTQMKATGEVMAIGRSFEAALLKAIRSLELTGVCGPYIKAIAQLTKREIEEKLRTPTDERLFVIFEAFRKGMDTKTIAKLTHIDPWFLRKIRGLVNLEQRIRQGGIKKLTKEKLMAAKQMGLGDKYIAELVNTEEAQIRALRKQYNILPAYKMVDTCAAEFPAETPYYYSTYEAEDEVEVSERRKIIVIGGGPIRIGQGIEFDYCSVHAVWSLRELGYEAIIINNNPETVSTDFDTSDKLYFEPLTEEDVLNIIEKEQPIEGCIVQFGGQTAINLSEALHLNNVRILGTAFEHIDIAEDRDKFEQLLRELNIPKPAGRAVTSEAEALNVAAAIGYPVLVRPSYVLGGRAMEIVENEQMLMNYIKYAAEVSPKHPILIDKYVLGQEGEVDVIADGKDFLIPGIMEHIERAGVHSGDSMAVCPPQSLSKDTIKQILEYTKKFTNALKVCGLMNIQYVIADGKVQVLEVNPRASRTVPYLSKATGIPMVKIAVNAMLGKPLKEQKYYRKATQGLYSAIKHSAVKAPVFSFSKLTALDVWLGPEMKSTGEIMCVDYEYSRALHKAMIAAGIDVPIRYGSLLATIADKDKADALAIIREFYNLGFKIFATKGTYLFLKQHNIESQLVKKISEGEPNILDLIKNERIDLVINTISQGRNPQREGAKVRRASVEHSIPCITSLDTARALLYALKLAKAEADSKFDCQPLDSYWEVK